MIASKESISLLFYSPIFSALTFICLEWTEGRKHQDGTYNTNPIEVIEKFIV